MSLRVALVHPFPWTEVRRGGERYLSDLAWYLAGAGHDVDVITSAAGPARVEVLDGATIRTYPRVSHPRLTRMGVTTVETHGAVAAAVLARRRYDVVHALTPTAALAGITSGHPTVYSELGHPTRMDLRSRPAAASLYRLVTSRAAVVTALSRSAAQCVQEVSGRRAEVLPPGVRLDAFPPDLAARTGPPRLLFMADASEVRKGVHFALAALDRVLDTHPGARLWLGGPGSHEWAVPGLGPRAARVLAATDVLGVGARDALPHRYRAATVTLLPAEHEAFGLVLVESLASGTPVVCTDDSGMREIVDDPAIGRTFPRDDIDALAGALGEVITLAADPATPARCTAHARRWGWAESVGAQHEVLYERIATRGARRMARA